MKNARLIPQLRLQAFFLSLLIGLLTLTIIPSVNAQMLDTGTWTKKQYKIKGGWEVDTSGEQTIIRFDKKFKTKSGPDLKIFLSKESIDTVTGKTATDNAVMVAVLKSNKGKQEYVLPADIDINEFTSLLIHCEAYAVLWGGANLPG